MLKKSSNGWAIEEVLKEQLAFETSKGIQLMVHYGTNEPFYTEELIKIYIEKEFNRLQAERLKSLPRKKAFTISQIEELHKDRTNGMSIRKLAKKYNKSTTTIQKYLKIVFEK